MKNIFNYDINFFFLNPASPPKKHRVGFDTSIGVRGSQRIKKKHVQGILVWDIANFGIDLKSSKYRVSTADTDTFKL